MNETDWIRQLRQQRERTDERAVDQEVARETARYEGLAEAFWLHLVAGLVAIVNTFNEVFLPGAKPADLLSGNLDSRTRTFTARKASSPGGQLTCHFDVDRRLIEVVLDGHVRVYPVRHRLAGQGLGLSHDVTVWDGNGQLLFEDVIVKEGDRAARAVMEQFLRRIC